MQNKKQKFEDRDQDIEESTVQMLTILMRLEREYGRVFSNIALEILIQQWKGPESY